MLKYPIGVVTANLKTPRSFNFSTKVFEFALQNANAFFSEINGNPRINHSFFTDFIVSENTNRASVEPRTDPVV